MKENKKETICSNCIKNDVCKYREEAELAEKKEIEKPNFMKARYECTHKRNNSIWG